MPNPKMDFDTEIKLYVFGSPFYHSIGKSEKGFEKLPLRTAVLHKHTILVNNSIPNY